MPITESDIKLLKSARMTDTPDGGGRMTGDVVQSGIDNNVFDDVSNLDRVYGNVSLRKVFGAVLTNDTDKYLGARVIIDEAPEDDNIHGLLFSASSVFDTRTQTSVKVESYLAAGAFYQGQLYGNHLAGMSTVMLIQQEDRALPTNGQVLLLRKNEGLVNEYDQYVRIIDVASSLQTFTDGQGDFTRAVVTCTTSDPLREAFPGFQAERIDTGLDYTGKTRLFDTVVADASQYYGIRPLAVAATTGSFTLKADATFSPLLPSAQVETPIAAGTPNPASGLPIAGVAPVTYTAAQNFNPTVSLYLPGGCQPTSLSILVSGQAEPITDDGGKLVSASVEVGAIDYANGLLTVATGFNFDPGKTITYTPAAHVLRAPLSTQIVIDIATRRQTFAGTIFPVPMPGTTSVSYRAQGEWYTLADTGSGGLVGANSGFGAGSVNLDTGSYSITLGALPDVGSSVIISWGVPTQETPLANATLKIAQDIMLPLAADAGVVTTGISITWPNGVGTNSATVASNGNITGHATGTFKFASGVLSFAPNALPPVGAQVTVNYTDGPKTSDSITHPARDGNGDVPVTSSLANILPNTLEVSWQTEVDLMSLDYYTRNQMSKMGLMADLTQTQVAKDDGSGNIVHSSGATIGTVNYSTGDIVFDPDTQTLFRAPIYEVGPWGWAYYYRGMAYQTFPSTYPATGAAVVLKYNTTGATNSRSHVVTFAPTFELVPGVVSGIVPGSVLLEVGGLLWGDNGVGTLRERVDPNWVTRGTINYLTGKVTLSTWVTAATNAVERRACTLTVGETVANEFVFRTAAAPLRPGSFSVQYAGTSGTQVVTADTNGDMAASGMSGTVNYETGLVSLLFGETVVAAGNESEVWYNVANVDGSGNIFKPVPIAVSTLNYSAVSYTYLPLDASILGLDPVRLPQDGRVPIFKSGRVVVVHNTQSLAPQMVTNSQTVNCGRERLARIRVFGNDGLEITAGFTENLDLGTVTFTSVAGYSQPVTIEHRIEDEALCAEAQITGDLRLTRPVTHDYPAPGSYVSSALIVGTLQAASQDGFAQETWLGEWSNVASGNPVLAAYNQLAYPIAVTNSGAITERWACVFYSSTGFDLVGEATGQIVTGASTAAPLAPVNPATGVAYFTLDAAGWGSGWSAGNVFRFNTSGANFPLWVARTVLQSPTAPPGTDQMTISIRGDIDQ